MISVYSYLALIDYVITSLGTEINSISSHDNILSCDGYLSLLVLNI